MRPRTREIDPDSLARLRSAARNGGASGLMMRARVVVAFFEGASYDKLRQQYGHSPTTISRWIGRFRAGGIAGLRDKKRQGPPGPKRASLLSWLPDVVRQSPRGFQIEEDRWTLRALALLHEQQTGIPVSLESVRRALGKFGRSWTRAKHTITSPDPEYEAKRGQ
jgi:transposase